MAKRTYTTRDLEEILQVAADLAEELGRAGLADMLREAANVNYEYEYSVLWETEMNPDLSWLEPNEDPDDYVVLEALAQRKRGASLLRLADVRLDQENWETVGSLSNITFSDQDVVYLGRLYEDQLGRADKSWLQTHVNDHQVEVSRELIVEARQQRS